ncbi:MAG TPA: hypothetical protein VM782_24450, partial [Stellaceae bacterium]|nr:hypothetical protein [Stellaceae bacterium]
GRLKAEIALNPDDLAKSLGENNITVLKFAANTYKRIYGTHSFLRSCRLCRRRKQLPPARQNG